MLLNGIKSVLLVFKIQVNTNTIEILALFQFYLYLLAHLKSFSCTAHSVSVTQHKVNATK